VWIKRNPIRVALFFADFLAIAATDREFNPV